FTLLPEKQVFHIQMLNAGDKSLVHTSPPVSLSVTQMHSRWSGSLPERNHAPFFSFMIFPSSGFLIQFLKNNSV
ncbi:MAG: hypothetical protein IKD69_13450, partial [Solobacterium sp.]|nr:hypothetical protein [Solobacterium sp.]